jgi:sugar lactone lactonase YvrE
MASNLQVVARENNLCGEAPIWDNGRSRLIWTDIEGKKVFQLMPRTGAHAVISQGLPVSGIALHKSRSLVFAGETGLHLWKGPGDVRTILSEHDGQKLLFNDIIADPKGRIYAGTVYWGASGMEKTGKLYLIDTHGKVTVVDQGIRLSNGLGFSPDDKKLYYADSAARRIYVYDVEKTGMLKNKRTFVQVPDTEGLPDGLTVDADGYVWCAQWYGSQVVRYNPEGGVDQRIPVPAKQVSSVAFGGDELKDLYITTAGNSWPSPLMPPGYDPSPASGEIGGSLYRLRVHTQGRPEHLAAVL